MTFTNAHVYDFIVCLYCIRKAFNIFVACTFYCMQFFVTSVSIAKEQKAETECLFLLLWCVDLFTLQRAILHDRCFERMSDIFSSDLTCFITNQRSVENLFCIKPMANKLLIDH